MGRNVGFVSSFNVGLLYIVLVGGRSERSTVVIVEHTVGV